MSDKFRMFEVVLEKRWRRWKWHVRTSAGDIVMSGLALGRAAATYEAYRAFFLLLQSAHNQSTRRTNPAGGIRRPSSRDGFRTHRHPGPGHDTSAGPSS